MELVHNYQVELSELRLEKFDYFIAASGCQKRCTYLLENIDTGNSENLVITYDESAGREARLENEKLFLKRGFDSIKADPDEKAGIERIMQRIFGGRISGNQNILVDYSCMTKVWIAAIIHFLLKNDFQTKRINIYFSYTPKKVNTLPQSSRLKSYEPLIFGNKKDFKNKPLALVAGLNNNHDIMKELADELNPASIFAFIPYFKHEDAYFQRILEGNAALLKDIPAERIFRYPAERPDQISSMITSLCLDLRLDSSVMLVPHGPKTFGLVSVLFAVRYPDTMIYDLKSGKQKVKDDPGDPAGEPVILKSVFSAEEEEDF
ncbi:MAG: hypothetical protein JW723_06345 [Bacteroidales bacterium]|nr:hypothetical protein [Bacteroidales bacterium]